MKHDVVVYSAHYNPKLDRVLRAFAYGIPRSLNARIGDMRRPVQSKYAVIFGLVKNSYKPTHLKKPIIDLVGIENTIVLESAFVLRKKYFAAGFGGIHGGADFKSDGKPLDRWKLMEVDVQPWQRRPEGYMLVCGQLPRDTNVQNTDHIGWCQKVVRYYRKIGVPVLFRPHPRSDDPMVYEISPDLLDTNKKISQSLSKARAVVTWNSTSGIDAMLAGVPVIAQGQDSMAGLIASLDLDPDKLIYPDRTPLLAKIGYAQWTLREMMDGLAWKHLMGNWNGEK